MWSPSFSDRLSSSVLGAVFGAVYGFAIAVMVAWITNSYLRADYVAYTAGVFCIMGFAVGPLIDDLVGRVTHILWESVLAWLAEPRVADSSKLETRDIGWGQSLLVLAL